MSWKDLFTKIGLSDIVETYEQSPDKIPDGFDVEKVANDYLLQRESVIIQSDKVKGMLKEANIVGIKKLNKSINETFGLGLTGEEASKLDTNELLSKATEKIKADKELATNGRATEIQKILETTTSELNATKLKLEKVDLDWQKKYEESENKFKNEQINFQKSKVFDEDFNKVKEYGDDIVQRENAKELTKLEYNKRGWYWNENGELRQGSDQVVTAPDGVTILKTISEANKIIASEKKLYVQSNRPAGNPVGTPATGNPSLDAEISAKQAKLTALVEGR